jgi:integrase
VRPQYRAAVALRPLQFPSVAHFTAAALSVVRRDAQVNGLSPLTVTWWEQSLRAFTNFLWHAKHDRAFLSGDVQRQVAVLDAWVCWLRNERRVSHTTVRTYWGALTAIGQRLERAHGFVNPFALLIPPPPGRLRPHVLTRPQAAKLLGLVAHYRWESRLLRARNLAAVGLMLFAGLRRGEVLRLAADDLHIDEGWLVVRRAKAPDGGTRRTAYLPPQLQAILRLYLHELRGARPTRTHEALLTTARRNVPATVVTITRLFQRLSTLLGFRVSPHMLRHTYATLLRQSGVADRVSMDLLGHKSLAMLKRYSHVFEEEYRREVQKLHVEFDGDLGVP